MLHPTIASATANERYRAMLQEAENERLYRRIQSNRPGLPEQYGQRLISLGLWLKAWSNPSPAVVSQAEK